MTKGSRGLVVTGNQIFNAMAGITFYGTSSDTVIEHNRIYQHSDNCIYVNQERVSAVIHHNRLYDCDHLMRLENTENLLQLDIYANLFYQPWFSPESGPKHIFISARHRFQDGSRVRIYHNSFAGGGWAVDIGGEGQRVNLPFVEVRNNLLSTRGLTSSGAVIWAVRDNHTTTLWFKDGQPSFILPARHPARDSAPSLTSLGWPGMTRAYYGDNRPDYGALQEPGEGARPAPGPAPLLPPVPTPVLPSVPSLPPTPTPHPAPEASPDISVTLILPAPASTVMGPTVMVAALGWGPIKGVQFLLDGQPVGEEQCCVTNDILWDRGFRSFGAKNNDPL